MPEPAAESLRIRAIRAREVLDSRGFPTVEADLAIDDPSRPGETLTARAIVPSGASTGEGEALELRDDDPRRYLGKGVLKALANVRDRIAPALVGRSFASQALLDDALRDLDGTADKSALGANAILPVSMAFLRAQALARRVPAYRMIASLYALPVDGAPRDEPGGVTLPVPLMNILNGGRHADNGLAIQEFMIVPLGFERFSEALRAGAEVFHRLKKLLLAQGLSTSVGDEGGFAPVFRGGRPHEQALSAILQAITDAGYRPGRDIALALDCAASEFRAEGTGYLFEGKERSSGEMTELYSQWVATYPILSIEDGLSEHDWDGWAELTRALGGRCQLVGDDLFVTNPSYLKRGIENGAGNAVLVKLNQIGTVTETLETMRLAARAGYSAVVSHRSGESEDTFIAELAVGTDCGQIKTGSASRTDRVAKYNQLLRIEEELGERARFGGSTALGRFRR